MYISSATITSYTVKKKFPGIVNKSRNMTSVFRNIA